MGYLQIIDKEVQRCEGCGVLHPPDIAFARVIELGRAYDAACENCHTPYVRADYEGDPSAWQCSICRARLGADDGFPAPQPSRR